MDTKDSQQPVTDGNLDLSSTMTSEDITVDEGYVSRNGESLIDDSNSTLSPSPAYQKAANVAQKQATSTEKKGQVSLESGNPAFPDVKIWDEISGTVESFSQNTITFLSWIEELDEITRNESMQSPFFNSLSSRKAAIATHIERVFSDVKKDAASLHRNLPSERDTVKAVLKRLESRCKELDVNIQHLSSDIVPVEDSQPHSDACNLLPSKLKDELVHLSKISGEINSQSASPSDHDASDSEDGHEEEKESCNSEEEELVMSTSSSMTNDASSTLTRRSLSRRNNWRQFVIEYKAILDWLNKMESVIDRAEQSDLPAADLDKVYRDYYGQFLSSKPKRECLNIKSNYIGTMFPEIRSEVDNKMDEIDDLWRSLMLRLSYYLFPSILDTNQSSNPNGPTRKKNKDNFSNPTNTSECHAPLNPDIQDPNIPLSDYSFHQIRDRLTLDAGVRNDTEPSDLSDRIQSFHSWLSALEDEAYRREDSVAIGWEPGRLTTLLEANKNRRKRLEEENEVVDALLSASNASSSLGDSASSNYSFSWSALMLQQRYTSLALFTTDMECILERRIEVVSKNSAGQTFSHPTVGMWTEHGVDMCSSAMTSCIKDDVTSSSETQNKRFTES